MSPCVEAVASSTRAMRLFPWQQITEEKDATGAGHGNSAHFSAYLASVPHHSPNLEGRALLVVACSARLQITIINYPAISIDMPNARVGVMPQPNNYHNNYPPGRGTWRNRGQQGGLSIEVSREV